MLSSNKVEDTCAALSQLFKNTIKTKILKTNEEPQQYSPGEALVFFVADWLTRLKLLKSEQLHLFIEEFAEDLVKFGNLIGDDIENRRTNVVSGKIGFVDRKLACMDGRETFLDLDTGKVTKVARVKELETIAYNLTSLYFKYTTGMK